MNIADLVSSVIGFRALLLFSWLHRLYLFEIILFVFKGRPVFDCLSVTNRR
jgi:hypothetical protein